MAKLPTLAFASQACVESVWIEMASLLLLLTLLSYSIGLFYSIVILAAKRRMVFAIPLSASIIGLGLNTVWIVVRAAQVGRVPLLGHSQELFSFLAWALVLYFLVTYFMYRTKALAAFLFPLVFLFLLVAWLFPAESRPPAMVEGVFGSWLFPLHTVLILLSYAAFFVMFVVGVMYLIQERELKSKKFSFVFFRMPSLKTCDEIGSRALHLGFVLLTLGMLFGMLLYEKREGRFWHNDPKEFIALLTWALYMGIIHNRLLSGWRGRKAAFFSIVGFSLIVFSLVGARFFGGFHAF